MAIGTVILMPGIRADADTEVLYPVHVVIEAEVLHDNAVDIDNLFQ